MADLYAIKEEQGGRIFLAYLDAPFPGDRAIKLSPAMLVKWKQYGDKIDALIAQARADLAALVFPSGD